MNQAAQVDNCIIEKEMHYGDTVVLHYKINYPQFCSLNFTSAICRMNRFYRDKAAAFQRYCETKLYQSAVKDYLYSVANGFPVRAYEALLVYTVTCNQDCIISLYFDEYQFTGGAHGNTVRSSQTWNLQTGCRITLRQMFPYTENYKKFLIATINAQIAAQIQNGQNYYFDNYEQLVEATFRPSNFCLTQEGVAVYFQQYDIAPYSSGIPVFLIPYAQDGAILPSCRCG